MTKAYKRGVHDNKFDELMNLMNYVKETKISASVFLILGEKVRIYVIYLNELLTLWSGIYGYKPSDKGVGFNYG